MTNIHKIINMLNRALDIDSFEQEEKTMFLATYLKVNKNQHILFTVNEALDVVAKMIKFGWDEEMTCCSIELIAQEYHNSLFQKVMLLSLKQSLEKKYISTAV